MFLNNRRRALGLSGDPANDTIDELRAQLELERGINAELQTEVEVLLRELLQARITLAPSPSAMNH